MSAPGSLYTIPPGTAFVDALAAGILAKCGDDPLVLADVTVLLPTRRACRALREAFLRVSEGRPLILPAMRPIGDVEEEEFLALEAPGMSGMESLDLPPAIIDQRRQLLLARLILKWNAAAPDPVTARITPDHAIRLAQELARLLDQVQTERLSFDRLETLVPEEHAAHWQRTLEFLGLLTAHWPAILEAEGALDPADRRNRLLERLAQRWSESPPAGPVIAAGSTGSVPATADLFAVIAALPNGCVVLPGLDRDADAATWDAIRLDQTHPQYGMARLLDRLEVPREDVTDWPHPGDASTPGAARAALVAEALRPADTTEAWRDLAHLEPAARTALLGDGHRDEDGAVRPVRRVVCPGDKEEAEVIALALRRALEMPGKTAALVTPDRRLARRVAASLARWDIEIDDSAGVPLDQTAPGVFFRLVADMVFQGFAPVAVLAACKHPLAAAGMALPEMRRRVRALERWVLRGPSPAPGIDGLREEVDGLRDRAARGAPDAPSVDTVAAIGELIDALDAGLQPLIALCDAKEASLTALVEAHIDAAHAFAADDETAGRERLWGGEAGEALAGFAEAVHRAADAMPAVPPASYPDMLDALMLGAVVRPRFGRHPRLNIWGPLEARLQHADLIVLGGLNEGGWPGDPPPDPWMSRPMRSDFGLPLPERRIGLAAHDFAQLFCAPEVLLTRAQKSDGTPTVPSRWLLRLETVLKGCDLQHAFEPDDSWLGLQRGLIAAEKHCPVESPKPTPPVAARPRRLSVTRIETWMRDPYSIYAREILGLRPLDPLEASPGAADRGTMIHDALDRFLRDHSDDLPADAEERLLAIGEAAFGAALARPSVRAFWWPRFERIARWFVACETERRTTLAATHTEVSGRLDLQGPMGPFALTAQADRIDRLVAGGLAIIDYKTGGVPSPKQMEAGFAPQLPLEAAIAQQGGFEGVSGAPVHSLAHWRLSGGAPPGAVHETAEDVAALAARALDNLRRMIAAFDDPAVPYLSTPEPDWPPAYPDYDHLARRREWSGGGERS